MTESQKEVKPKTEVVTYIGAGMESPSPIKFMGIVKFNRGESIPTKNIPSHVMSKILGNPSFVLGKITAKDLKEMDNKFAEEAEKQHLEDIRVNSIFVKRHG